MYIIRVIKKKYIISIVYYKSKNIYIIRVKSIFKKSKKEKEAFKNFWL